MLVTLFSKLLFFASMYSTDACCNYQGGYLSRRSSSRRTELGIHRIAQESTASELPAVAEQHPARARGEIYPEAAAELQSSTWYVILNSSHWSEVIYILFAGFKFLYPGH